MRLFWGNWGSRNEVKERVEEVEEFKSIRETGKDNAEIAEERAAEFTQRARRLGRQDAEVEILRLSLSDSLRMTGWWNWVRGGAGRAKARRLHKKIHKKR